MAYDADTVDTVEKVTERAFEGKIPGLPKAPCIQSEVVVTRIPNFPAQHV